MPFRSRIVPRACCSSVPATSSAAVTLTNLDRIACGDGDLARRECDRGDVAVSVLEPMQHRIWRGKRLRHRCERAHAVKTVRSREHLNVVLLGELSNDRPQLWLRSIVNPILCFVDQQKTV